MIIKTTEDFVKFSNWIRQQSEVAFDIETNGLNVRKDTIIGFGVSNDTESFYIPHKQFLDGKLVEVLPAWQCMVALKHLQEKKVITFNGAFDIPFTTNFFDVDLLDSLWADTLLAKHTVDELPPFRLKQIAKKVYGADSTREQEEMMASVKANGGHGPSDMYKCDLDIMAKYCEKDCILTMKLYRHYLKQIKEENLEDFFFKDEVMPLYKEVTIPMEQGGIPLDMELLNSSLSEINTDINNLEDSIQEHIAPELDNFITWYVNRHYPAKNTGSFAQAVVAYYKLPLPKTKSGKYSLSKKNVEDLVQSPAKEFLLGKGKLHPRVARMVQLSLIKEEEQKYPFNLSSKHHLKKLFFEQLGEKAVSYTDKGNPQVDDSFLDLMAEKYSWVKSLQDYNKLIKIRGAYIERFLDQSEDGIFYPSFFQHRTISGRYGSDIQQLPRQLSPGQASELVVKHTNRVRKFFISGEDHVFIDADYESLEPHVFAHVSGDDGLRDIFRSGLDFYSAIAIQTEKLQNVSADKTSKTYLGKVDKQRRQKAKAYCCEGSTLVETSKGYVKIKDIKEDSLVKTSKGFKKVNKLFKRKARTILVHTNRGTIRCTEDHPFFINNEWVEAKDLKEKDEIIYETSNCLNNNYLPIYSNMYYKNGGNKPLGELKLDNEWAYFSGALLGDGIVSISQRLNTQGHGLKGYIGMCGLKEDGVTKWFKQFMENLGYKTRVSEDRGHFESIVVVNSEMAKIVYNTLNLGKWEDGQKKCKNLEVPTYIMNAPIKLKLNFLAGLLDTDGYIKMNHDMPSINLVSKDHRLSTGVCLLLNSLGVECSYSLEYNKTYEKNYYKISPTRLGCKRLSELELHHHMKCKRKSDALREYINYIPTFKSRCKSPQVIKIEPSESCEVYDIRVEDEHHFFANGVKVHNCLGIPYGMSAYKLQFEIGVSQAEAEGLRKQYLDAYPDLKQWMQRSEEQAVTDGFVRSEAGRVRHLWEAKRIVGKYGLDILDSLELWKRYHDDPGEYAKMKELRKKLSNYLNNAKNFQIQSLSTSIVNRAAISINRYMKKNQVPGYVCAQIHDQLVVRVPEQYQNAMKVQVQDIMENNYKISIDLKAPAEIGRNFADAH